MPNENTDVVITGLGCISPLGNSVEETWKNYMLGVSPIKTKTLHFQGFPDINVTCPMGAVSNINLNETIKKITGKRGSSLDTQGKLAVIASHEALIDAGLIGDISLKTAGVVYGVGCFGLESLEYGYEKVFAGRRVHPMTIPKVMPFAPVSAISMFFGVQGPSFVTSSACSSSSMAILQGYYMIQSGLTEKVIVGGAEAPLTIGHLKSWQSLGAISQTGCFPFTRQRDGTVLAEGAATLVLESKNSAEKRGAKVYGKILGGVCTADANHITQPKTSSIRNVIDKAISNLMIEKATPFLISSHGTGTILNDECEAQALRDVFESYLDDSVVIATKACHGHLLGATGAMEFLIGILALRKREVPAMLNSQMLNYPFNLPLPRTALPINDLKHLLSNTFAFGGSNVVLAGEVL